MPAIIHNFKGTYIEHVDNYVNNQYHSAQEKIETPPAEDVVAVDTSFFCTKQFTVDIIEKNIRQAIELASSKADACRRLMSLEIQGYIVLSNVKDEQKAALVNPFAAPKFTLTGEDFRKARNS